MSYILDDTGLGGEFGGEFVSAYFPVPLSSLKEVPRAPAVAWAEPSEVAEQNREILLTQAIEDDRRSQRAAARGDFPQAWRLAEEAQAKREQADVLGTSAFVPPSGLGQQFQVEPSSLLVGLGVLALGMFVLGVRAEPKLRKGRRQKIEKKMEKLRGQLRKLEEEAGRR